MRFVRFLFLTSGEQSCTFPYAGLVSQARTEIARGTAKAMRNDWRRFYVRNLGDGYKTAALGSKHTLLTLSLPGALTEFQQKRVTAEIERRRHEAKIGD